MPEKRSQKNYLAASCLPASREALSKRDKMAQSNLLELKEAGNWGGELGSSTYVSSLHLGSLGILGESLDFG